MSKDTLSLKKMLEHPENLEVFNTHCDQRIKSHRVPLDVTEVKRVCEDTLHHHHFGVVKEAEHASHADYAPIWPAVLLSVFISFILLAMSAALLLRHVNEKVSDFHAFVYPCKTGYLTANGGCADQTAITTGPAASTATTSAVLNPTFTNATQNPDGMIIGKSAPRDQTTIILKVSTSCWVGVHQQGDDYHWPAKIYSVTEPPPFVKIDKGRRVRVRSGCPGDIQYYVNSKQVHPATQSQSNRIELVSLP